MTPAERWGAALASWAVPAEILEQAPVPPWVHPPAMFVVGDDVDAAPRTPAFELAAEALPGSVLDVGCGGGGSSVPLGADRITSLTGVDESAEMLDNFLRACERRAIAARTYRGRWPDVADDVPPSDVVVCHHVAYNVADIDPFVRALTAHARRRVVVELPVAHPTSPFNPLWKRFWGIDRPTEPSAELFVEVVRATGVDPIVRSHERAPRATNLAADEMVAFARTRLCLTPDRDPEVADALADAGPLTVHTVVAVAWDGGAA